VDSGWRASCTLFFVSLPAACLGARWMPDTGSCLQTSALFLQRRITFVGANGAPSEIILNRSPRR
jgi:hypothetical protein